MKKVVFLPLVILALLYSCTQQPEQAGAGKNTNAASIKTIELSVKGMSCTGCENTIKEAVGQLAGVSECTASFEAGQAIVKYDTTKTGIQAITQAITEAGYEVTGYMAKTQ